MMVTTFLSRQNNHVRSQVMNSLSTFSSTDTDNSLTSVRQCAMRKRKRWSAIKMKDVGDEDRPLWRNLYSQAILMVFMFKKEGMPIKSEEWLSVVQTLYPNVFRTMEIHLDWKDVCHGVRLPLYTANFVGHNPSVKLFICHEERH